MTQVSADALQAAMDRVDRERTRSRLLLFCVFAMTIAAWIAMMFAKDDHTALPYGLAAVMGAVFVAGLAAQKTAHESTRTILRAIETLAQDK